MDTESSGKDESPQNDGKYILIPASSFKTGVQVLDMC